MKVLALGLDLEKKSLAKAKAMTFFLKV